MRFFHPQNWRLFGRNTSSTFSKIKQISLNSKSGCYCIISSLQNARIANPRQRGIGVINANLNRPRCKRGRGGARTTNPRHLFAFLANNFNTGVINANLNRPRCKRGRGGHGLQICAIDGRRFIFSLTTTKSKNCVISYKKTEP